MTEVIGFSPGTLQQALSIIPDAAMACNEAGIIIGWNKDAQRLFGSSNGQLEGCRLSKLFPDLAEWEKQTDFILMARLGTLDGEHSLTPMQGRPRIVWSCTKLLATSGETSEKGRLVLVTLRDVTSRSANEKKLREMATTDELTGLFNRRYLQSVVDFEVERSRRFGLKLACAIIDIDKFKDVNDAYGHQVGDVALRAVADHLRRSCRKLDTVCRWGGDEFVVLLLVKEVAGLQTSLQRLVTAASSLQVSANGVRISVTLSCGAALAVMHEEAKISDLMSCADELLYRAKREGRNRVCIEEVDLPRMKK
jgi:diguanylate cyclase (GGDEF)-like protein/PAS domain S-box-containing protein